MSNVNFKSNQNTTRLFAVDYLKAIATVLVIATHTLSRDQNLAIGGPFWINMAVPIFMIISGFTYSMSANNKNISTLKEYFSWKIISPKLSRLLFPYIVVIALETILFMVIFFKLPFASEMVPKSFIALFMGYITGGWGPGSYYVPILIQLLILFPVMFLVFKKSPVIAVTLSFMLHLCFDILSNTLPISNGLYRLSILRYLVFIVMGIILYNYKDKLIVKKHFIILLSIFSMSYIAIVNYCGYTPIIFSKWMRTSMPTVFWAFGLTTLGMTYLEKKNQSWFTNTVNLVGKSSYHIFLVQMVCFKFGLKYFSRLLHTNILFQCILNIFFCCVFGIIFYYFESSLKKRIKVKKGKYN